VPPRPKRSAPDCQLSTPALLRAESWQTGAWGQSQSGLCAGYTPRSGRRLPSPSADARPRCVPPAQKPEQRDPRDPTNRDPASCASLRSGCGMKDRQTLRFSCLRGWASALLPTPATRAVICSGATTAPAPADAGPPVLASAKYNCVCGREPVAPVTLTANGPAAQTGAGARTPPIRWPTLV
jgi:hypothetical protein